MCAGLWARPLFAARREVMLLLMRLGIHCRDTWFRRLQAPARVRPPLGDRFLKDYYPRPLEGGPPLMPYAKRPPRAPPKSSAAEPRVRSRQWHSGRAPLGAWGTIMPQVQKLGFGHSRCCRAHLPRGGPALPEGPASGRTGPPGARALGPERWGNRAMLLARPGSPCLPIPPSLRPPGVLPVHRPPPRRRALAHRRPWGQRTPDPRNAPNLTSRLTMEGQ